VQPHLLADDRRVLGPKAHGRGPRPGQAGAARPQVCHAARYTYDYEYGGCGNWPFNAAYADAYRDLNAVVTRLGSLTDLERLVHAGIPVITSQSFLEEELTGAGYGTAGHLMTVVGFTPGGDVIANDPASPDNEAVRGVYRRRERENIWLRTKRYDASGRVRGGTGGVCYVFWPVGSDTESAPCCARSGWPEHVSPTAARQRAGPSRKPPFRRPRRTWLPAGADSGRNWSRPESFGSFP
jgi:hypothetical protein